MGVRYFLFVTIVISNVLLAEGHVVGFNSIDMNVPAGDTGPTDWTSPNGTNMPLLTSGRSTNRPFTEGETWAQVVNGQIKIFRADANGVGKEQPIRGVSAAVAAGTSAAAVAAPAGSSGGGNPITIRKNTSDNLPRTLTIDGNTYVVMTPERSANRPWKTDEAFVFTEPGSGSYQIFKVDGTGRGIPQGAPVAWRAF